MNSVCYLRAHNGIEVIRITPGAISLQENDFSHAEWSLGPAALPDGAVARVHQLCASQTSCPLPSSPRPILTQKSRPTLLRGAAFTRLAP